MFNKIAKIGLLITAPLIGLILITGLDNHRTSILEIELTDDGFYPPVLNIKKGEVVTFKTSRNKSFWPASDYHPSHAIYPEFDPREPIPENQIWSFQFNTPGEWKYHDHLSPYFLGKIIVDEKNEKRCDGKKCIEEKILSELTKIGLSKTFDRISEIYSNEDLFPGGCHDIAHSIGIASYKLYTKDKDSIITQKAAYCASGFYHGFMEAFLGVTKDPIQARELCNYMAEKLGESSPDTLLSCFHGIGHGAIETTVSKYKTYDEESLTSPALKLCEKASKSEEELYRCASGVFNGVANFYINNQFGLSYNKEDPLWLCSKQKTKIYKESCYGNMNSLINWISNSDFSKALPFIENIKDDVYAIPAMQYMSAMASVSLIKNAEIAIMLCRSSRESLKIPCITGIADGLLENGPPEREYIQSINFCETKIMTTEEHNECLKYALNFRRWYSPKKIESTCSKYPQYKNICPTDNK